MPQSESISKITSALTKAQAEFGPVPKTKRGQDGNRSFLYADLADVLNEIRPKLNKQGIYLSHPLVLDRDGEHLRTTTRVDLGDEFIQSDGIRLSFTEGAGKAQGAEVTYSRRIDNNSFFGIFPDDDLDAPDLKPGEQKSAPKIAPKPVAPAPRPQTQTSVTTPAPTQQSSQPIITNGVFSATNDDLPPVFGDDVPPPTELEPKMSQEMAEFTDSLGQPSDFVPLSEKRNSEIQGQLREWTKDKILPTRNLSVYLDKVHSGKKQFDVPASQWEDTFKKISDAVAGGPDAIKAFFKENK